MQLNFRQYSSEGKPLLILHGLFGSLANWNWHARELAGKFAVYTLDLRNHGSSPHSAVMDYPAMAKDVSEFVADKALGNIFLLGHSMGGKVAMQLVLVEPQCVARLVIADIAPVRYPAAEGDHDNVFAGLEALDLSAITSRTEADSAMREFIVEEGVRQFLLANLVKGDSGEFSWRFNLPALKANYESLRDAPQAGKSFDNPVLFIKGALSNYIQEQHRKVIMTQFPQATIAEIPDAGHWLHAEKPQQFNKLVQDFLLAGG